MIRLSDHIAAAGGWLSLEAFMQLALHHPQEGYYSSSIENIGQRGDFSTTPTLSPILAKAIVAHWKEACSRCGRRLPLLEIGAGSGALAVKILERLGFWNLPHVCANSSTFCWEAALKFTPPWKKR